MSFVDEYAELLDEVTEQRGDGHLLATEELRRRRDIGHGDWCPCQSRQGQSCRELRQLVGWRVVADIWGRR